MRLLLVELQRLSWRRAVRLLAVVSVVVPILILAGLAWSTRPVSDAELADAQRMADQQTVQMREEVERCEADPEQYGVGQQGAPGNCEDMMGGEPEAEWFLARPPLSVEDAPNESGSGAAVLAVALAMLMGTTFAGADWASGSMSNQLLFEPRRLRVWGAKAAALALAALAVAAVTMAVFWGLFAGLAASRELTIGSAVWGNMGWLTLRTSLLASAAALGGFALTMLLRNTVGTLGLMFAFAVGGAILVSALPITGSGRWQLQNNVLGILQGGYAYYDGSLVQCSDADYQAGKDCSGEAFLTLGEGLRYLSVVLAAGMALSIPSFLRRDVP